MNPDIHPLSTSLRGGETGANYEILGKLATGGMAELFLARAPLPSGRPGPVVVLKRILPHLAEDPEFIRMFRDEAYLAATLRHPNIVQVFDIGKQGEDYFFTMEYVHGENLRAILRSAQKRGESIPLTHILTIALGITAALHHAHEQTDDQGRPLHIVHRDVSPTNVLVAYDGSVKIVDFGIAKAAAGTHVTQAGMLKGKASYMSPEQCWASKVDRRSDVFAIGILLYEMTTLTRLFKGENELAILHQVLSGAAEPPSKRRPGYPPELERIVMRALATEPGERYPTAEALQADLMRFGQQNAIRPSHPALGQFLRGLFGNKPLPWADNPAMHNPAAPQPGRPVSVVASPAPHPPRPNQAPAAAPPRPAPPRPAAAPPKQGPPRPPRGPGSRVPSAKAWRPGGRSKAPPPPPAPASVPQPDSGHSGATTAKQAKAAQPQPPAHAPSRPTAPRSAVVPKPPPRPDPRPPAARPPQPPPKPAPSVASYAPPPPDYDIDPEESKTAIAVPRAELSGAYDPREDAKTRVSGTSASDVAAFMAAAPPANLEGEDGGSMGVKTKVAKRTEDEVAAFLAAAPPADLVDENPSPMIVKTQIAPATAEEIRALADAAAKAALKPQAQDLFAAPAPPTQPGKHPSPAASPPPASPPRPAAPPTPSPSIPAPQDLPPPGGQPPRQNIPSPASLPPPGGQFAPTATQPPSATPPPPAAQAQPPPASMQPPSQPPGGNRRDTILNAPARPAALGGPPRTAPPSAPARQGHSQSADNDLEDAATMRMSVEHAAYASPAPGSAPAAVGHTPATPPDALQQAAVAAGQHPAMGHPPQAPIAHWQAAPHQGIPGGGHTVPMPMVDLEDEPLVVPGRNSKLIAMLVTVVVGLGLGAAGVWIFLID